MGAFFAFDQADRMLQERLEDRSRLVDAAGTTGQVDDQAAATDPGIGPREGPVTGVPGGGDADRFRDSGRGAFDDVAGCFRSHVARGKTRTACSEDQIRTTRAGPVDQALADQFPVIRDEFTPDDLRIDRLSESNQTFPTHVGGFRFVIQVVCT